MLRIGDESISLTRSPVFSLYLPTDLWRDDFLYNRFDLIYSVTPREMCVRAISRDGRAHPMIASFDPFGFFMGLSSLLRVASRGNGIDVF